MWCLNLLEIGICCWEHFHCLVFLPNHHFLPGHVAPLLLLAGIFMPNLSIPSPISFHTRNKSASSVESLVPHALLFGFSVHGLGCCWTLLLPALNRCIVRAITYVCTILQDLQRWKVLCTQKPGSFQFHSEMIGVKIPSSGSDVIALLKKWAPSRCYQLLPGNFLLPQNDVIQLEICSTAVSLRSFNQCECGLQNQPLEHCCRIYSPITESSVYFVNNTRTAFCLVPCAFYMDMHMDSFLICIFSIES